MNSANLAVTVTKDTVVQFVYAVAQHHCMQALALSCDLTNMQVYRMNVQNLRLLDVSAALPVRERTTEY